MWQVLFYVTPITVGIALVILGVSAVVVARWNRRSPRLFPREARWLLGTAAAMYLLILGGPLLGWDKVGTTGWGITWNPLSAYEELRQRTLASEGAYLALGPSAEETVYYGARELSPEELEQARREVDPGDAAYYRFSLPTAASYGSTPTATTWTSTNARNLRLSRHLLSAPSRQQASLWRRRSSTPCSSCPSAFWLSLLSPPGGRA